MKTYKIIPALAVFSIAFFSCEEDNSFNPVSIDTYEDQVLDLAEIDPVFDATNELKTAFYPYAANAVEFDVFFGISEDEEAVKVIAGDSARIEYPRGGDYTVKFIAKSASGDTEEISGLVSVASPFDAPFELDFSNLDGFFSFGVELTTVNNPFLSGDNTEATEVAKFDRSAASFQGIGFESKDAEGNPVPFIDFTGPIRILNLKVFSEKAVPVAFILQEPVATDRGVEVVANHTGTGWENLSFDFTNDGGKEFVEGTDDTGAPAVADDKYQKFVIFIDGPSEEATVSYLDDLIQEKQQ